MCTVPPSSVWGPSRELWPNIQVWAAEIGAKNSAVSFWGLLACAGVCSGRGSFATGPRGFTLTRAVCLGL